MGGRLSQTKENPYRTRMTYMGNRVEYDVVTSTETANLETIKIHANRVILSPGAQ